MSTHQRQKLHDAAQAFCAAFSEKKPPEELFAHFTTSEDVLVIEHGLTKLSAFLGREFKGQDGIRKYFELIGSNMAYDGMSFDRCIVDTETRDVVCRGNARFEWKETAQSWDEAFVYLLKFDDGLKVARLEIWADSGAAYLASRSEL